MRPKRVTEAERELEEAREKANKVNKLLSNLENERKETEDRLLELQDQLPGSLAAHAMGELTDNELAETRKEIKELKRKVIKIPLTLKGLKKLSHQLPVKQKLANRVILNFERAREKYQDLKERIRESYDSVLAEDLCDIAKELELVGDAEAFLLEQVENV